MNSTELERIARLETKIKIICEQVGSLAGVVDKIRTNDLYHIQEDISGLKSDMRINSLKIAIITGSLILIGDRILGNLARLLLQ